MQNLMPEDCLLFCGASILFLFFVLPDGLGDAFNIEERLMTPLLLAAACWFVMKSKNKVSLTKTISFVMIVLTLQTIDRLIAFGETDRDLEEYAEVEKYIPDRSAVFAIDLDQVADLPLDRKLGSPLTLALRFGPERAFLGTIIGNRNIAFISNYEALEVRPYFNLKYQPWLNSIVGDDDFDVIARNELEKKSLSSLIGQIRAGKAPILYLVTWSLNPQSLDDLRSQAALKAIEINYNRVFTSSRSHLSLYRLH
jgi:hypothetical protein